MRRWLTDQVCRLVARLAADLPPGRREWGEAIVAEQSAVPDGERRLRWALGSLWFVVAHRGPAAAPTIEAPVRSWTRPVCVAVGILTVSPWLAVSVQGLAERDAPDGSPRSTAIMLAAQILVVVAFLANRRRTAGRRPRITLLAALLGYGAAAAASSLDNVGEPALAVVAALLFAGPPLLAAFPLLSTSAIASEGVRPAD
ncbi:hypothetical protein Q0Z83_024860 [Actinoplanes sichuanensis]|uniref:Uncharacterized protein n=1 Tax=Actinoplanes sichuanensis TaxID=512349 RepID=A0ABW4A0F9_9ACTN|nr:hypothetical protein [Actinoplanes sichuanensis]BEL04295.1 hypothetical protein Q0Z83_024860 [Actinoplanes sichuanensis]